MPLQCGFCFPDWVPNAQRILSRIASSANTILFPRKLLFMPPLKFDFLLLLTLWRCWVSTKPEGSQARCHDSLFPYVVYVSQKFSSWIGAVASHVNVWYPPPLRGFWPGHSLSRNFLSKATVWCNLPPQSSRRNSHIRMISLLVFKITTIIIKFIATSKGNIHSEYNCQYSFIHLCVICNPWCFYLNTSLFN